MNHRSNEEIIHNSPNIILKKGSILFNGTMDSTRNSPPEYKYKHSSRNYDTHMMFLCPYITDAIPYATNGYLRVYHVKKNVTLKHLPSRLGFLSMSNKNRICPHNGCYIEHSEKSCEIMICDSADVLELMGYSKVHVDYDPLPIIRNLKFVRKSENGALTTNESKNYELVELITNIFISNNKKLLIIENA